VKWNAAQNMIGFSVKQLGTYENYPQEGKNTALHMQMDHVRPKHTPMDCLKLR
jgi:hypothetical protein